MMKDTVRTRYYCFFMLIILSGMIGLIAGSFCDMKISETVYVRNETISSIIEAVCFFPIYLPPILLFASLSKRTNISFVSILCGVITVAGLTVMFYAGLRYLEKRSFLTVPVYVSIPLLALISTMLGICILRSLDNASVEVRRKILYLSFIGTAYLLWELLFAQTLKLLAGRPRYEEILNDNSLRFADWFEFTGQGGSSFPSGHTAQACGIFLILFIPLLFRKHEGRSTSFMVLSYLHVILTAYSRIVLGKHFLSDVSFSVIFMGCGLFLLFRYYFRHPSAVS